MRRGHVSSYYSRLLTPLRKSTSANGYFPASKAGRAIDRWVKGLLDKTVPKSWEEGTRQNLQRRVEQCIGDYYCESNRASQQMTDLDLAGLGYRV